MCGRAYQTYTEEELAFKYLNGQPPGLDWFRQNFNMAPTQNSPVVVAKNDEPVIERSRWGLVPFWAKSVQAAAKYSLFNARSEQITEKLSYAKACQRRRCVVPLSGYYEWKRTGESKRPFAIHLRDHQIMSVAGVWECWQPEGDAEPVHSFSIVTTQANTFMAEIHNRMPVILNKQDVEHWLNPEVQEPEQVLPLLRPCPPEWLTAYEVSTTVNSPRNNSPDLLQRRSTTAT